MRLGLGVAIALSIMLLPMAAHADTIDPFIKRYFQATELVALPANDQGETQLFSLQNFSDGKRIFAETCINCHVGGATLPNPDEPLSLAALAGATPPRDNIAALVAFIRQPMTYDGQDISFWCREVPETWMSDSDVENVAAFILRAAEKAPKWGTTSEF